MLFEHWTDRDAIRMAAFTSPDQNDRTAFERRWARLRSDVSTTNRVVEIDGLEATRPLYAGAASDNAASIRVLTKCGFLIVGEGRGFAHGRNEETDEVVLRLDA